jgi:hypothetical protein
MRSFSIEGAVTKLVVSGFTVNRARVLKFRIHLPPAESQQTFGTASSLELQNRVQHQEATNPPIVAKTHSGGLPASPRSRRFGLVGNEQ